MKTKLTAIAFLLLPTISTPTFADLTLTAGEFVQNTDGTVTHTPTGLIWQACSAGQTFEPSFGTCLGEAKTFQWQDDNDEKNSAINMTSDFAGQTDWRIPNLAELRSLVDLKKYQPTVNKSLFPQTPTGNYFLSSSTYTQSSSYQWAINFGQGIDTYTSYGYVRFVRGATVSFVISLKDFSDNGDGTVTHSKTGLTWQRCAVGQTWNDGGCEGKVTEYKQTEALKLTANTGGKTDWRLPTYKELLTIVDYSAHSPAANVVVFPDAPSDYFWTSTQVAGDGYNSYAWYVNFDNGSATYDGKTATHAARLVRGSMTSSTSSSTTPTTSGSVDLTATLTANPSPAKINQTLTYSATVTNKGKATATGTTLTFYVAPKFMSYTASSNGCELKNNGLSVVCQIGDLAAGANVTKTMNVIMQKVGGVSSSVLAKSNETDANPADNIGRTATGVRK